MEAALAKQVILSTEYHGICQAILEAVLEGKEEYVVPHPVDYRNIERLKKDGYDITTTSSNRATEIEISWENYKGPISEDIQETADFIALEILMTSRIHPAIAMVGISGLDDLMNMLIHDDDSSENTADEHRSSFVRTVLEKMKDFYDENSSEAQGATKDSEESQEAKSATDSAVK